MLRATLINMEWPGYKASIYIYCMQEYLIDYVNVLDSHECVIMTACS